MAEAKDDIVLSIRGMCKSFGRNRVLDHRHQLYCWCSSSSGGYAGRARSVGSNYGFNVRRAQSRNRLSPFWIEWVYLLKLRKSRLEARIRFNGAVRSLEQELAESTATVTVSAANPMIAFNPRPATSLPDNLTINRVRKVSAMKCTPQKMMYSASVCEARRESLSESPVRSAYW